MKLRRLELIFIAITLSFVFFIGGFFVGRSNSPVTIGEFGSLHVETSIAPSLLETQLENPRANTVGSSQADPEAPTIEKAENTVSYNSEPQTLIPGALRGGDGRININTASRNELMDLPGIGPSLAQNIIEYRNNHGLFNTIEDIMNVSGIASGRFERIKDKITTE